MLVVLGNWYVFTTGGNPALVEYGWSKALRSLFVGAVVGLLVAEVLLRQMRSLLEGGFLARYVAMAGAMYVGWRRPASRAPRRSISIRVLRGSGASNNTLLWCRIKMQKVGCSSHSC